MSNGGKTEKERANGRKFNSKASYLKDSSLSLVGVGRKEGRMKDGWMKREGEEKMESRINEDGDKSG